MTLYLDIHIIQTVPPSCMNRDDTGSPKQAVYGAARRARVSSQAWKRAARTYFEAHAAGQPAGTRTKQAPRLLTARLVQLANVPELQATNICDLALQTAGFQTEKDKSSGEPRTKYLVFFGRAQLDELAKLLARLADQLVPLGDNSEAIKKILEPYKDTMAGILQRGHSVDIALFGRMVADIPGMQVDAAVQVAHAISTHPVEIEFDYYTAIDDENTQEEPGASMIGTVEFNSATLYRYATIGLHQLADNLDGDSELARSAAVRFLESFALSMPTGRQNSFANRTAPSLVAVALRDNQPVNLVSAFEQPVVSRDLEDGLVATSIARLAQGMDDASTVWGLVPKFQAASYATLPMDASLLTKTFGPSVPFTQLQTDILAALRNAG